MLCFTEPVAKELKATRTAWKIQWRCGGLNNRNLLILPAKLLLKHLYRKILNGSDFTQSSIKDKCRVLSIKISVTGILEALAVCEYTFSCLQGYCRGLGAPKVKGGWPWWMESGFQCVLSPLLGANEEALAAVVCSQEGWGLPKALIPVLLAIHNSQCSGMTWAIKWKGKNIGCL